MKRNYCQIYFIGVVIVISWVSPLFAVPTLNFDIDEVTCCPLNDEEKELWDNLHYISDAVSVDALFPNRMESFTFHGITVNMTGDMVYGALPMKSIVDKDTVIPFSQDMESASQPIPEPATLLLIGTGLLCAVGVSRKMNDSTKKLTGTNELSENENIEGFDYCEYIGDEEFSDDVDEQVSLSKKEKLNR